MVFGRGGWGGSAVIGRLIDFNEPQLTYMARMIEILRELSLR
jgi:hypothetical protein